MKTERIGDALVVRQGDLTRIVPVSGQPYWLSGDGLIGIDDDDEDVTHWHQINAGRLVSVKSMTTTNLQLDLLQAVVEEGLRLVGKGRG